MAFGLSEADWTAVAAIGQVVGAMATFAAVLVSLWIVLSERRERFEVRVGRRTIFQHVGPEVSTVAFQISNHGARPLQVATLSWRVGWSRWGPRWLRYQYGFQMPDDLPLGQNPPFELPPGSSATALLGIGRFIEGRAIQDDILGKRTVPLFGRVLPPIHGIVCTSIGTRVVVRAEPELEQMLREIADGTFRFEPGD